MDGLLVSLAITCSGSIFCRSLADRTWSTSALAASRTRSCVEIRASSS
eukprot:CAMPEP_0196754964 /NCGR_PEP_ID=MMETSP1091-20130531/95779_1 /TAXON_ID=302021 /ORGANISM="Rhodomonas sp., Strain CCMP768" /LENGTH=47 /DNA_ID= /DNA_START= /DNA_END= /DNA_ORIENTATION=